jgi:exonuclease III
LVETNPGPPRGSNNLHPPHALYGDLGIRKHSENATELQIFHCNVNSLLKPGRFECLREVFDNTSSTVLCIQEARIYKKTQPGLYAINGFNAHLAVGKRRKSYSIIIYTSKDLHMTPLVASDTQDYFTQWFKVTKPATKTNMIICSLYRHPSAKVAFFDDFSAELDRMANSSRQMVVVGDTNIDTLSQKTCLSTRFKTMMADHGFENHINDITRPISSSCIDHIFTNTLFEPFQSQNLRTYNENQHYLGDHNLVALMLDDPTDQAPSRHKCTYTTTHNTNKVDLSRLAADLQYIDWTEVENAESVDLKVESMSRILLSYIDKNSPITRSATCGCKKASERYRTEIPTELKVIISERNKIYKKWMYAKKHNHANKSELGISYRNIRNTVNHKKKTIMDKYWMDKLKDVRGVKDRFALLNRILGKTKDCGVAAIENNLKVILTDQKEIASELNNYFTTVGKAFSESASATAPEFIQRAGKNTQKFRFQVPSSQCVFRHIRGLNLNKPAGPDTISPKVIKSCAPALTYIIHHIFESCIRSNTFPKAWKTSRVTAVHKKGSRTECGNYRPISISSILSKVLEKILGDQMTHFLAENKLLSECQFGYKKGLSCQDTVAALTEDIRTQMEKRRDTVVVYLDLSKAFDCVNHSLLCKILEREFNFGFNALQMVQSFLTGRTQFVQVGNVASTENNVDCGVPQGSVTGPLYFTMYVNSVSLLAQHSKIIQYADDTALYLSGPNIDDITKRLQTDLSRVADGFKQLGLQINATKTQTQIFRRNTQTPNVVLSLFETRLEEHQTVKYLGVTIDNKLKFSEHIKTVISKQQASIHALRKIRSKLTQQTALAYHRTMMMPYSDFACIVYDPSTQELKQRLEVLQKKSLRAALNQPIGHTADIRRTANATTQEARRLYFLLTFVYRCVHQMVPTTLNSLFPLSTNESRRLRTTDAHDDLSVITHIAMSHYMKNSIANKGTQIWNSLPHNIRASPNLKTFKTHIKKLDALTRVS